MSQNGSKTELSFKNTESVRLGLWSYGKEEVLNRLNINLDTG